MSNYWKFRASIGSTDSEVIKNVVDGDTVDLTADLGFGVTRRLTLRLEGVDTAETHNTAHDSDEYQLGVEQANFVRDWLITAMQLGKGDWYLHLETDKDTRSFTRWIGDIQRTCDQQWLSHAIISQWPEARYDH